MAVSKSSVFDSMPRQRIEGDNIDYYDVMIIGRTGMGKSSTAAKLVIAANLNPNNYRGSWNFEVTIMKDDRIVFCDLTTWPLWKSDEERISAMSNLKNISFFRDMGYPHTAINNCGLNQPENEPTADFQLISNEITKIRILDVPGFFGKDCDTLHLATISAASVTHTKGLAIMREVLHIQAAMRMNFKRILYFLPERGVLDGDSQILQMELKTMMHYFGNSIFDCMVLIATVSPDVYAEHLLSANQPGVISFSKNDEEMTQKCFQRSLSYILSPGGRLPDHKPPIVFISMNDTCENILIKVKSAPVIFDGIRLAYEHTTCIRCGLNVKLIKKGAEVVKVACYAGEDPSLCIPYNKSSCHPMIVSKHWRITKLLGGISHTITRKNFRGAWPDFRNPDDEICVHCKRVPGEPGCIRVNKFCKVKNKTLIVDHELIEPMIMTDDSEQEVEIRKITHGKGAQVSFLQQRVLKCDHNGLHYSMKDYGLTIIIPKGSVAMGEEIPIEVGVTLYGPFNFPKDTRLISPILSLRLLEEKTLTEPLQLRITLHHILGELSELRARSHRVHFYFSDHISSDPTYEFHPLNSNLISQSFTGNYGVIIMRKFCILCMAASDTPELQSEIGYRLTRVMCTSDLINEAYLCLSYDLNAYLQVMKQQFPEEDGYMLNSSSRLTFVNFPARLRFVPEENEHCTLVLDPAEIRVSDVDVMEKMMMTTLDGDVYPPRVRIKVDMKDIDMVRIQIKVKGSANDELLHTDLSFPFKEFIEEEKHIAAVQKAMEEQGRLEHTIVHSVFVGPARSGKNSLMERLLGRMPSSLSPSTGVAENTVEVKVMQKSTTVAANVEESIWSIMDYDDEAIKLLCINNTSQIKSRDEFSLASQFMKRTSHSSTDHQNASVASALPEEETAVDGSAPLEISKDDIDEKSVLKRKPSNFNSVDSTLASDSHLLPASVSRRPKINYVPPLEILKSALKTKDLKGLQRYFQKSWSLYLTNTGGQMEFQEVLPLLVSGPSVFFFTFRLDRDLTEYYDIEYQLSDGTNTKPYRSTLTTIEGILQTLASISAMGTFVYRGLQKREEPLRPRVFFIGTHRDKIDRAILDNHIATVDQQLLDVIQPTSHYRNIIEFASPNQLIFTVDNFSDSDSDFQRIRTAVERVVVRDEFQMTCPAHWLIYSLALRHIQSRVVSYDHCSVIAGQCGIIDQKELNEALHFIHSKMGLIRYFPYEGTKDIVIIDPQFLFDKVTELIVDTFTFEKSSKQRMDEFKQKGIFSITEFERISARSKSEIGSTQFRKLLESLRIAAPFEADGERKLFFPCVLAHTSKAKIKQRPAADGKRVPPLMVSFECGYCPKGVTGALIKYLMAELASPWALKADEIYKDQVSFHVGLCDTVVINMCPTHFEISCIRDPQFTNEGGEYPIEKTCSEIREALEAGIKRILIDMSYINSQHSLTFPCRAPGCKGSHPAVLLSKGNNYSLRCDRSGKSFKIPPSLEVWGIGKKEPLKHTTSVSSKEQSTTLTSEHHALLLEQLKKHSSKWRLLGSELGFHPNELDNIEAAPLLLQGAPTTWLTQLLVDWLEWAPGDGRGSTNFATLEGLKKALLKANLGATAHNLNISHS